MKQSKEWLNRIIDVERVEVPTDAYRMPSEHFEERSKIWFKVIATIRNNGFIAREAQMTVIDTNILGKVRTHESDRVRVRSSRFFGATKIEIEVSEEQLGADILEIIIKVFPLVDGKDKEEGFEIYHTKGNRVIKHPHIEEEVGTSG